VTAAEQLAWAATITPEEWCRRIRDGYRGKPYAFEKTNYFRALVELRKVGPSPPPPLPNGPDTSFGRNWICMAQEPKIAQVYPARFGVAFTADRAYEKPSAAQIAWHKQRGQRTAVWCDCHSTFPDEAERVRQQIGVDLVIGEGESAAAFQVALDAGLRMAWINLSALTRTQKNAIQEGKIITPNELYLNQDASRAERENWENLPIPGRLVACYDASGEASTGRRFSMGQYIAVGKWNRLTDSFYDPGATDNDRRLIV
jgi:hypothetical protein